MASHVLIWPNLDSEPQIFACGAQEVEKGKASIEFVPPQLVVDDARDWVDWREDSNADYRRFEEQYEDDEEVEDFYFSSAAGRLRIVGNRRFGENGFISSGRMQARPVPQPRPSKVRPPSPPPCLGRPGTASACCKLSGMIPPVLTPASVHTAVGREPSAVHVQRWTE